MKLILENNPDSRETRRTTMKRILFLTNYPSPYRVNFFDALGKLSQVTVLYSDRKEKKQHRSKNWFVTGEGNFEAVQLKKRVLSIKGRDLCTDVVEWLKKPWDAIIIHGYGTPTQIYAMRWLKKHKIPYYMEVDGGLIRQDGKLKHFIKQKMVDGASAWLSTGSYTTDYLCHYGAVREKCYRFPFSSLWEKDLLPELPELSRKEEAKKNLHMGEQKILLTIGQFIPRKGFDVLMEAAKGLPSNVGIYIIGGEPTEEYVQLQKNLPHVHFIGFQKKEELKQYYLAADLFVLPTREDIWGLVINEAMAFGLPVITTERCVAGLELVENGVNGFIIPAGKSEPLQKKILETLSMDLRAMGEQSLEKIRPYTIENMAKVHMDILNAGEAAL